MCKILVKCSNTSLHIEALKEQDVVDVYDNIQLLIKAMIGHGVMNINIFYCGHVSFKHSPEEVSVYVE